MGPPTGRPGTGGRGAAAEADRGMRVLVTGATGLVGSHVAAEAAGRGYAVRALARAASDRRALRDLDVEIAEGDVLDAASVERAARGCEAVFHVAGTYDRRPGGDERMMRLHRDGTANVLLVAAEAGARRVVVTSSGVTCAFGPRGAPGTALDDVAPLAAGFRGSLLGYYRSKRAMEAAAVGASAPRGIEVVVVNPCFVLGARDVKPTSGELIARLARARVPVVPAGGNTFITARDCARGHLGALLRGVPGRRYLLGAWPLGYAEVAGEVLRALGRQDRVVVVPSPALAVAAALAGGVVRAFPPLGRRVDPFTLAQMARFRAWREPELETLLGGPPEPIARGIGEAVAWFRAEGVIR